MAVRPDTTYSVESQEQQGTWLNTADRFDVAVVRFGIQHLPTHGKDVQYNLAANKYRGVQYQNEKNNAN